jgi:hypothetical protein
MTATCHGVVKRTGLVCSKPAKWVNDKGIPMCGHHVRNCRKSIPIHNNPQTDVKQNCSKKQTRITQFMKPEKDTDYMNRAIVLTLYMTCACMCMNMILMCILLTHTTKFA